MPAHAQLRREVIEPLGEQAARLAHQPGLHGVAQLRLAGVVRQADVQRAPRHAGQRLGLHEHAAGRAVALARVQHQQHGLAQVAEFGAVFPDDAGGLDALLALARLAELGDDPARFFMQGGFHLGHGCPARRAHRQAFGTDHEANGAAPAALEFIGHAGAGKGDATVGAGVAEGGGGEHVLERLGGRCGGWSSRCQRCGALFSSYIFRSCLRPPFLVWMRILFRTLRCGAAQAKQIQHQLAHAARSRGAARHVG